MHALHDVLHIGIVCEQKGMVPEFPSPCSFLIMKFGVGSMCVCVLHV